MPRYFFHICDDKGAVPDREGMDFADDETAKREGKASARDLLRDDILTGQEIDHRRVEVTRQDGRVVANYRLRDLLN